MATQNVRPSRRADLALAIAVRAVAGLVVALIIVYALTVYFDRQRDYLGSPIGQGEKQVRDRIAKQPSNPGLRVDLATVYLQARRFDDAIRTTNEALKIKRDYAPAFLIAGMAWLNKKDYANAISNLQQAATLMRDLPMAGENASLEEAHFYLGFAYYQTQDWDKALQNLKAAAAINRASSDTLYYLGEVYLKKKAPDLAIAALTDAISYDPKYGPAQYALGEAYERQGQRTLAAEHYRLALEAGKGKFAKAKTALAKFGSAAERFEAGQKLIAQGKLDAGVREIELSLAIDPLFVNASMALGKAYERQAAKAGPAAERRLRLDLADRMYKRVESLSPKYPGIAEAIARTQAALKAEKNR